MFSPLRGQESGRGLKFTGKTQVPLMLALHASRASAQSARSIPVMSIATWSDQQLDELRQHGDPPADALASRLFEHPATGEQEFGRLGYNHILNLTDKMQEAPELVFANDSELYRQLHAMPPEFVDYFDPMELPSWVDPAKLVVASRMWMDNSLGMLVVLFLGSLPACYLMARGIPALYQTNKLSDPRYISQRIYETGLMLDAVMKDGGFKILTDIAGAPKDALLAALKKLDPSGAWVSEGRNLRRKSDAPQVPLSHDGILEHLSEHETKTRRFVWGPGYVTVKKVRFLHASMRYMLQHPEQFAAAAPQKYFRSC